MSHSRLMLFVLVLTACSASPGDRASTCSDGLLEPGSVIDCEDPACAALPACSREDASTPVPSMPDGGTLPHRDASPPRPCVAPMDVVFVIDVSTSMADEVAGIREGIDSIWAATEARSIDARFGVVVFVDDVAAVNGCAPFDSVSALQSELMSWQRFTSSNGQPGGSSSPNSDCAENSLDAIHAAATTCTWRPEATRLLIHVTDDTFAERPARLSRRIDVQRTYAETLEALVSREIRVGAFAAPGAGEYCGAGTSPDVGRGFHAPYMGMPSLPEATGGRAWSIRDVRAGTLDMAEAIIEFAQDEHCAPF